MKHFGLFYTLLQRFLNFPVVFFWHITSNESNHAIPTYDIVDDSFDWNWVVFKDHVLMFTITSIRKSVS